VVFVSLNRRVYKGKITDKDQLLKKNEISR
jgi:hypothetical protein